MTKEICANTPTEPALGSTKQLVDKRDQKKYWVTRLQDGNCWMTQNLDYDLGSSLSAETSDVESDISGLTVTGYTNATGVGEWGTDNAALKYYNPGLYVHTTPTEINNCGSVAKLSDCTNYGWKEYAPGDDEHYLAGNYYSWAAATAGTGKDLTSGNAPGSICPKNWKLPLSGPDNNGTSGSFYYLLNSYDYSFRTENDNTITDLVSSTGQNIATAPLYFLRGGYVNTASLISAGIYGHYWSRTTASSTNAFYLIFDSASVYPSRSTSRFYGLSIRCLVI